MSKYMQILIHLHFYVIAGALNIFEVSLNLQKVIAIRMQCISKRKNESFFNQIWQDETQREMGFSFSSLMDFSMYDCRASVKSGERAALSESEVRFCF